MPLPPCPVLGVVPMLVNAKWLLMDREWKLNFLCEYSSRSEGSTGGNRLAGSTSFPFRQHNQLPLDLSACHTRAPQ